MRGKVLLLLAAVSVLAACGNQKSASLAEGTAGIMNGTNVTSPNKYSKHTVYLHIQSLGGSGSCTGSVLDSQTILTAAHCLIGARGAVIVFATNAQDPRNVSKEQIRQVDLATVYPKFNPGPAGASLAADGETSPSPTEAKIVTVEELAKKLEDNNVVLNDVALLHFAGGLPQGYEPVQLGASEAQAQPGAELHMIGYGLARVGSTTKIVDGKTVTVPVPDRSTTGQLRETKVAISRYSDKTKLILTEGTKTSVCNGDSGGPAFVTDASGAAVQVGIAEAVGNEYCNSVSMHTSIFPYLDWIKETAAKLAEQSEKAAATTPMS